MQQTNASTSPYLLGLLDRACRGEEASGELLIAMLDAPLCKRPKAFLALASALCACPVVLATAAAAYGGGLPSCRRRGAHKFRPTEISK